ncbi:hypothetical protein J6590_104200 [Homalodisca vitripennis]|nr:hypothetical protein J6590_104200 [Homalodisca vitripennis]
MIDVHHSKIIRAVRQLQETWIPYRHISAGTENVHMSISTKAQGPPSETNLKCSEPDSLPAYLCRDWKCAHQEVSYRKPGSDERTPGEGPPSETNLKGSEPDSLPAHLCREWKCAHVD